MSYVQRCHQRYRPLGCPEVISNDELVDAFNAYVGRFNDENAAAIAAGQVSAVPQSSVEFIEKASGIKSRYVMDKAGVLDPAAHAPAHCSARPDDELSLHGRDRRRGRAAMRCAAAGASRQRYRRA